MTRLAKVAVLAATMVLLAAAMSAAVTTLPAADERREPQWHSTHLYTGSAGTRVYDSALAAMVDSYTAATDQKIVVLGQCFSGGFVDDLAYIGRDRSKPRTNMVVATAAEYFESSWGRAFVTEWRNAVNANANTTMLQAFNTARTNDVYGPSPAVPNRDMENPQYHSSSDAMDAAVLGEKGTSDSYAILFVGDADADAVRFRTATEEIYTTLRDTYHYAADHIKVLYTDTGAGDPKYGGVSIVNDQATNATLDKALSDLKLKDNGTADQLLFWGFNHGDQTTRDVPASFSVQKAQAGDLDGFEGHPGKIAYFKPGDPVLTVYDQSTQDNYGAIGDVYLGRQFDSTLTFDEEALLLTGQQLDAISPGNDKLGKAIWFSVENSTGDEGLATTPVREHSDRGEVPGDIYFSSASGTNRLEMEESELGLFSRLVTSPGVQPVSAKDTKDDDNLFALEWTDPFTSTGNDIYFSLLNDSLVYLNTFGNILDWTDGTLTRDLMLSDLGLQPSDDIDAMALYVGLDHVFNMNTDWILFSLAAADGQMGGADLWLSRGDGSRWIYLTAADLGLEADDDVDALDVIPEPLTLCGVVLSTGLLARYARRRSR